VCVKKIPAGSKFLELKKLNEEKISCVIIIIAIDFNGANIMHIFDCTKKRGEKIMNYELADARRLLYFKRTNFMHKQGYTVWCGVGDMKKAYPHYMRISFFNL
jgi:NADH/NAD ratio-sensing transcriptional regulator Rex